MGDTLCFAAAVETFDCNWVVRCVSVVAAALYSAEFIGAMSAWLMAVTARLTTSSPAFSLVREQLVFVDSRSGCQDKVSVVRDRLVLRMRTS